MSATSSAGKRSPRRNRSEEPGGMSSLLLHALLGFSASLLLSLPLCLLGAMICVLSPDPLSRILPVSLGALYLSALLGGLITRRLHKGSALLSGLSTGLLLSVFFLLVSLFFSSSPFSTGMLLLLRGLVLFFSVIGAYLGAPRAKIHRRRHSSRVFDFF